MPYTRQRPDYCEIEDLPALSLSIPSQRNINIFTKPGSQGNMPSSPKLGDSLGHIRINELLYEMKTKHSSQPNSHIRIARKVKIDLESKGQNPNPRCQNRQCINTHSTDLFPYHTDTIC